MNDSFKYYSLKIFEEVNINIMTKYNALESKEIDKNIVHFKQFEDTFNEIDAKFDSAINNMIELKIQKEIQNELNFIN